MEMWMGDNLIAPVGAPPPRRRRHAPGRALLGVVCLVAAVSCTKTPVDSRQAALDQHGVVPVPVLVQAAKGTWFTLGEATRIRTPPGEAARVGEDLAASLGPATGYRLPVAAGGEPARAGDIALEFTTNDRLGDEGYELEVTKEAAIVRANRPAGLFWGTQTLRQLLPAGIDSPARQPGPWRIPGGRITDHPRFPWRGAALDVARHFFGVEEVKRYLDLMARYKLNILHLHLTDNQGWRIAIQRWPKLATVGGRTEVGGGPGGFYTQQEFAEIVRYAKDRHVTVVPEVDVPGHTNAALASYGELNCDGRPTKPYTGTDIFPSSLCVDKPVTDRFLKEVFGELAAITPGPYLHIGGEEAERLIPDRYAAFVERVQRIVRGHGKRVIGWQEVAAAKLLPDTVAQYWGSPFVPPDAVQEAARRGTKLVLSPASKAYLDAKYDEETQLGHAMFGYVEVRNAYDWEPTTLLEGVGEDDILGVEAQLWTETVDTLDEVEFMAFPRLPGIAEVAWSPPTTRDWEGFRRRLAGHGPRWEAMAVNYYRSPQVPWPQ
jgi:hexosaminidase